MPSYDEMVLSWLPDAVTFGPGHTNLHPACALFPRVFPLRYHVNGSDRAIELSFLQYTVGVLTARAQ
jgi:hypothetical protein